MSAPKYRIEPLAQGHVRHGFSCGVHELDAFIDRPELPLAAVFVAVDPADDPGRVIGYYAMSQGTLDARAWPEDIGARGPHARALPAYVIDPLAVDRSYQGRGLGMHLFMDALTRAARAADQKVGSAFVLVEARDAKARPFYRRWQFEPLPGDPLRLYLPLKTVRLLIAEAAGVPPSGV